MRPEARQAYDVCRRLEEGLAALAITPRPVALDMRRGALSPGRPATLPLHLVDQPSDDGFSSYEVQPG